MVGISSRAMLAVFGRRLPSYFALLASVVGKRKVGIRLSPFVKVKFKDMDGLEILAIIMKAAEKFNELEIAYIHLAEAGWGGTPKTPINFRGKFRYTIIATGNKTPKEANAMCNVILFCILVFVKRIA